MKKNVKIKNIMKGENQIEHTGIHINTICGNGTLLYINSWNVPKRKQIHPKKLWIGTRLSKRWTCKKNAGKSRAIQRFSCLRINVEFNRKRRISISNCNFLPDLYYLCSNLWFCDSFKKNILITGSSCINSFYFIIIAIDNFINLYKMHLNWRKILGVFFKYSNPLKIELLKII